jgi:hypothetical protein
VDAGNLKPGEKVRTDTGTDATVVSFTLESTPTTMWDITVDGAHDFFVGTGAVLVHNCTLPAPETEGPQLVPRLGEVGRVTQSDVAQMPGGQSAAQTLFDQYANQSGARPVVKPSYSGTMVQLSNGSTVGIRMSATGPVVDFNGSVGGPWRLHFTTP